MCARNERSVLRSGTGVVEGTRGDERPWNEAGPRVGYDAVFSRTAAGSSVDIQRNRSGGSRENEDTTVNATLD